MGHSQDTEVPKLEDVGPDLADFLPDTSDGYIAKAGTALVNPSHKADAIAVEDALKSVHDPEIPVNIYDLGLIYDVDRKQNGDIYVIKAGDLVEFPAGLNCEWEVNKSIKKHYYFF